MFCRFVTWKFANQLHISVIEICHCHDKLFVWISVAGSKANEKSKDIGDCTHEERKTSNKPVWFLYAISRHCVWMVCISCSESTLAWKIDGFLEI